MNKKNLKVISLIVLAVIGVLALNRLYMQKNKKDTTIVDDSTTATAEKPLSITVKGESVDSFITYTFDGSKYMKLQQSPLGKFAPQEIKKEEFDIAYQKHLA